MNAVVAIGRNVNGEPMSAEYWAGFTNAARNVCRRFGVLIAEVIGPSVSFEYGHEDAAWYVMTLEGDRDEFLARLDAIRHTYWQDAIAVTFGETELVGL